MAANLFTPILNDRTRSIHFFNGRLLTGEDMTEEQHGQRAVHELLGQSIGDGVVRGLEVSIDDTTSLATPVVRVTGGLAINRRGEPLLLTPETTRVQLVRSAAPPPAPKTIFTACTPPQSGVYVAGAGVYLLTICSTVAGDGAAPVSGLGGQPTGCNTRYDIDAVQFRLIEVPLTDAERGEPNLLRNRVAYRCFGVDALTSFATDPFGTSAAPPTLLDQLRPHALTDCDVPLATLYWTATGGVVWVDVWSVRRRVAGGGIASHVAMSDRRLAVSEAMVLQFEDEIQQLSLTTATTAETNFRYLPPVGLLPLAMRGRAGSNYQTFFGNHTTRGPAFIPDAKLHSVIATALHFPPIQIDVPEVLWLYLVAGNSLAANERGGPKGYLAFVNGHVAYAANARFDLGRLNLANYAFI
jgi:hypothetical protein